MKCTLSNLFIFVAGAAIGSAATWRFFKNKYERIAQEEIDSVKEVFSRRRFEHVEQDSDDVECDEMNDYRDHLETQGYVDYSANDKGVDDIKNPYVIAPEDFGDNDNYDTESLTYYADGILADDTDEIIEDVDYLVGEDSLSHFGEYEDDSVFVRNDRLKCDYEILLDSRKYAEIKTHQVVK